MPRITQRPPLSLYIHIPWCAKKCPYCDFNSHVHAGALPETAYIETLLADLDAEPHTAARSAIISVFIGGGTPSLFTPEAIDRLLSGLRNRLRLADDAEITLEANPGTLEQRRLAEFRACGINRVSLGIQSFSNASLKRLGRIHDSRQARTAVEAARQAGFENLNLDLMYGLPGQTAAEALSDVRTAVSLNPDHISHYQLTIEPDTAFFNRPPRLPAEDRIWAMQEAAQSVLAGAGYTQYEVSAYARNGRQCRHNLNYWCFGDYLGIGAGAHQKLTCPQTQSLKRQWKHRLPADYMQTVPAAAHIAGETILGDADRLFEFMLNALRLTGGFDSPLFETRTGLAIASAEPALADAESKCLIARSGTRIQPTETGRRFLNELLLLFMA